MDGGEHDSPLLALVLLRGFQHEVCQKEVQIPVAGGHAPHLVQIGAPLGVVFRIELLEQGIVLLDHLADQLGRRGLRPPPDAVQKVELLEELRMLPAQPGKGLGVALAEARVDALARLGAYAAEEGRQPQEGRIVHGVDDELEVGDDVLDVGCLGILETAVLAVLDAPLVELHLEQVGLVA